MHLNPVQALTAALGAGVVGLVGLLAVAPDPSQPPASALVVGLNAEPKSLDPHATTAQNDFRIVVNLYEGLVRFAEGSLDVEPALAESWEVSADETEYLFHLRDGVTFHDGTDLTAEAVVFNFERMLDGAHPFADTGPFPLASFMFGAIEGVEAVDERTVRFRLSEPFAPLLAHLAYPTGLIVSPAAVREHGAAFGRHPSGTGPFRFVAWEPSRLVRLERSDDYWGEPARSEELLFRPIGDAMTRVAELRAGALDVVPELSADHVAWFREADGFTVHESIGPHLWFLILNAKEPPFDSRAMRQAVNYAIDKEALVDEILRGTAEVAASPIVPAFDWAHDPDLAPYPHDPEKARALVAEAGYGDGAEVTLLIPSSGSGMLEPVAMATAIQADLKAVGVEVVIETFEWNTYLGKVNAGLEGLGDMAAMAWMTDDPDTLPYLALRSAAHPPGFNSGYYANPDVDRLVEAARRETDRAERGRLYRDVARLVHDDAPWVFVASWKQPAVVADRVEGFELEPSFLLELSDVGKSGGG